MAFKLILILIFLRPFVSSLSYPMAERYYSCLLLIVCFCFLASKKKINKVYPAQGFLCLFFLAVIAAVFFSTNPGKSQALLPQSLSCFFIFYAVLTANQQQQRTIINTVIFSAVCVSSYALYWFHSGPRELLGYLSEQKIIYPFAREFLNRKRAFMPFVLPNMLAGYLIMALPLGLGAFSKKIQHLVFILPMLALLLLSQSVGALFSLFLALLLYITFFSKSWSKRGLFILVTVFLALALVVILRNYRSAYFTGSLFSLTNRLDYWQKTWVIILRHPWRGSGLGNFSALNSQFAHNSYLQIWAEMGLLGIIGFLGFISQAFWATHSTKLSKDKLYAGLVIASFSFPIHNFVDFSFFLPEVAAFWWIIMALLLSAQKSGDSQSV
ncbi:MAG: O-antigen ligase family protein [Candidatus Omnitrophica bacterium]|nr:O-antigen ligase family protein [Candidatus Omnitrophota bacterium]